ncbi:hypothetical protein K7X08_021629 [Anisodus acutangulus]|uniref:FAD/NAD(P)-binding domain-containing protein n=1 Tax=Anisodus acutangulus TaxID=402998 RepID=A0A9Q1M8C3_9SOLA|nr:hypothetical protein K7X08_021629 [Anisodus acutangulus]
MEIYQFLNSLAFILLLFIFLLLRKWKTQKLKLPPGPWKLPFIGSLHHLALAGPLPHHGLTNLAKRYGPLMYLQLGEVVMIVISSPRMAKEVLKTHDLVFATRPKLTYADIVHYNSTDVVFSPYGAYWRQIRKICTLELLSAKMVNNFVSSIRQDELSNMISSTRSMSDLPLNLTEKIIWFTSSVTCRSALGKICNEHQDKLIYLMKEILSLSIAVNLADFFPKWKLLHDLGGSKSRLLEVHGKVDEILEYVVNEHKQNRANGKKRNGELGSEDLIDVMLRVRESGELQLPITDDNIKAIILDMFSAGEEKSRDPFFSDHHPEFHQQIPGFRLYMATSSKSSKHKRGNAVGGGPTSVELAAEISVDFPDKKVTLVHRGSRLLEFIGERASKKALNWLTSKKVEVIMGQSVDVNSASDGVYKTSGGETVVADCHLVCIGTPFGSAWLKETILKDSLDSRGRLMVDSNLRIKGHSNIFAIGDITDVPELKQGYLAQEHAKVAAKNIMSLIKGVEDHHKLAVYKPATKALALVSLGRKGVAQFPCLSIAGRVPGMVKSRDLFVGKTRKGLGLQPDV